jgi:hypothetical protein
LNHLTASEHYKLAAMCPKVRRDVPSMHNRKRKTLRCGLVIMVDL